MGKRTKIVFVSGEVVAALCSGSPAGQWVRWDGGVPADAACVGMGYDWLTHRVWVRFEHPSFPEVADGDAIPVADGPVATALERGGEANPPNPPAPETGIDDDLEEAWQAMHRSPGFAPSAVVRAGMEKAAHEASPPTLVVVNPAATAPGSYADLGRLAGADQPRAEDSP